MIEILRDMKYIKKCQNLTIAWFHFRKLVNVLSETPESQKEDLPYEQSRLTHVLKDTLGGNSRVIFLCSISSEHRYFLFLHFFLRLLDSVVLTGAWEMQVQIWNIKYTKIWWTSKAFAKQSCDKWDIRRWCKWLEWSDTSVEGITSEAHRSRTILQLYEHLLKI